MENKAIEKADLHLFIDKGLYVYAKVQAVHLYKGNTSAFVEMLIREYKEATEEVGAVPEYIEQPELQAEPSITMPKPKVKLE